MELNATITIEETTLTGMIETAVSDVLESQKGEANHTEAIDTLNSHGEVLRSLNLAVDQVRHNVGGKIDMLVHCQETAEEQIAMLNRRVDTLTQWIAGFRQSILVTTGQPGFMADLNADTTPPLNARYVSDDKVADELINMIDDVTESLVPTGMLGGLPD